MKSLTTPGRSSFLVASGFLSLTSCPLDLTDRTAQSVPEDWVLSTWGPSHKPRAVGVVTSVRQEPPVLRGGGVSGLVGKGGRSL